MTLNKEIGLDDKGSAIVEFVYNNGWENRYQLAKCTKYNGKKKGQIYEIRNCLYKYNIGTD